jgi:Protein of unknown function (DUF3224)
MTNGTMHAAGTCTPTSWDEGPYAELDGAPRLTHAKITNTYRGDLEGEGTSQVLMFYPSATSATYHGYERVTGRLGGRSGSFVLEGVGTFEGGIATTTWRVVPGSGTGGLTGLRGEGGNDAPGGGTEIPYRLDYHFD